MQVSCLMWLPEWLAGLDPETETCPPHTHTPSSHSGCCPLLLLQLGIAILIALCLTEKTFTFWFSFIISPKHTDWQHDPFVLLASDNMSDLDTCYGILEVGAIQFDRNSMNIYIIHAAILRLGRTRGCPVSLLTLEIREQVSPVLISGEGPSPLIWHGFSITTHTFHFEVCPCGTVSCRSGRIVFSNLNIRSWHSMTNWARLSKLMVLVIKFHGKSHGPLFDSEQAVTIVSHIPAKAHLLSSAQTRTLLHFHGGIDSTDLYFFSI